MIEEIIESRVAIWGIAQYFDCDSDLFHFMTVSKDIYAHFREMMEYRMRIVRINRGIATTDIFRTIAILVVDDKRAFMTMVMMSKWTYLTLREDAHAATTLIWNKCIICREKTRDGNYYSCRICWRRMCIGCHGYDWFDRCCTCGRFACRPMGTFGCLHRCRMCGLNQCRDCIVERVPHPELQPQDLMRRYIGGIYDFLLMTQ